MSLAADEIEVIRFALDDDSAVSLVEACSWLSEEEADRAERFKFENLRDRYTRGRGLLRRELARHLDCGAADLEFGTGPQGKPFLRGHDLHFNLSHSEEIAALAISRIPDVGIDIEKFDRKVDFDGLAKRCFREVEWAAYSEASPQEKSRRFFHLWTAKEARMKATGEGFQLSPQKIEIGFRDGLPDSCIEPAKPAAFLQAVTFPDGDFGAACTVAALSHFQLSVVRRQEAES